MPAPTKFSRLRHLVRFDKKVEVEDPAGGTTSDWVPQFTCWADIRPLKGGESVIAQRLQSSQPVMIFVRSEQRTQAITSAWRAVKVVDGAPSRYFALKTAEDMEGDQKFITMLAEAGAADA